MNDERTALFAGAVSILVLLLQAGPVVFLEWWTDRGFRGSPPVFESIGQTYVALVQVTGIVVGVLTVVFALGLGYYVAPRLDLPREFDAFVSAIAIGSAGGILVGGILFRTLVFLAQGAGPVSLDGFSIFMTVVAFLRLLVEVALPVLVGGIAGVALFAFRERDAAGRTV